MARLSDLEVKQEILKLVTQAKEIREGKSTLEIIRNHAWELHTIDVRLEALNWSLGKTN